MPIIASIRRQLEAGHTVETGCKIACDRIEIVSHDLLLALRDRGRVCLVPLRHCGP